MARWSGGGGQSAQHQPHLPVLRPCIGREPPNPSRFAGVQCGFEENADLVGAINGLAAGHAVLACGGMVQSGIQRSKNPPKRLCRSVLLFGAVGIAFLQVGEDVKTVTDLCFRAISTRPLIP